MKQIEMSDGVSNLMKTMNYKFVLTEEHSEPYIFYKDEGKKDKCISLTVSLYDEYDSIVRTKVIPLKLSLLYGNGLPCTNDILSLSPDTRLLIDSSGSTIIKLRINAVSKGHQSQMFKIQIEEDTGDPNIFSFIPPVCSVPVEVRSKRNNLKRKFVDFSNFMTLNSIMNNPESNTKLNQQLNVSSDVNPSQLSGRNPQSNLPATSSSSSSINALATSANVQYLPTSASMINPSIKNNPIINPNPSPVIKPEISQNLSSSNLPSSQLYPPQQDTCIFLSNSSYIQSQSTYSQQQLGTIAETSNETASSSTISLQSAGTQNTSNLDDFPAAENPNASPILELLEQPKKASVDVSDMALDSAVESVLRWAGAVMNGLQEIQWKLIGYERNSDGTIDSSRPLFSMNNPSQVITDIIQMYSTETMASLQCLVKEAEEFRRQAFHDAVQMLPKEMEEINTPVTLGVTTTNNSPVVSSVTTGNPTNTNAVVTNNPQSLREKESEVAVSLVQLVESCCCSSSDNNSQSSHQDNVPTNTSCVKPATCAELKSSTEKPVKKETGNMIEKFDWSNSNTEMLLGMTVNSDRQVHYIVGKSFKTPEGTIGLPAYDDTKHLIGFYRESMNCNRNIVLKYRSVNAHRGIPLADNYVLAAQIELDELLKESSAKVFSLPSCQDDLERLKQDALIFSWMNGETDVGSSTVGGGDIMETSSSRNNGAMWS